MNPIQVTVTGPGQCITAEMELIRRALVAHGFKVNVIDEYPYDGANMDNYLENQKKYAPEWTIDLVAEHCPWGG